MSTRIFLIRHGSTAANLNNIFAGRSSEPLHEQGQQQLNEVAKKLSRFRIKHIFCGPLPRTEMSAEIIMNVTGAPIKACSAFNEIDIAHWDGLTKEKIREKFGRQYPTWLESPDKFSVDSCETLEDVQIRAVKGIEEIVAQHSGENIVVVSHLIVVRCLVLYFQKIPISNFRSIKISNGSITQLIIDDAGKAEIITEN